MTRILALSTLLIVGAIAMPTDFSTAPASISVSTVARFTEGFLYGVLHKEVGSLDTCI